MKTFTGPSTNSNQKENEKKQTRMAIANIFRLHRNAKKGNCNAFSVTHEQKSVAIHKLSYSKYSSNLTI